MPKTVKLLVTELGDEVCVFDAETLATSGMDEAAAKEAFGADAYWLTVSLKAATFGDQQKVAREAGGDESLLPQKRFAIAVTDWRKRVANAESESVLPVSEAAFAELYPVVGNAIASVILADWYPVATKTSDFFKSWSAKQADSAQDKS